MELWHDPGDGDAVCLASEVDTAESFLEQARGLMFRRRFPTGSAMIFPFDDVDRRSIHMVAVPFSLDVLWLIDDEVQKVKRLRPMIGVAWGDADTVIEVPAGTCDDVAVGDTVYLKEV